MKYISWHATLYVFLKFKMQINCTSELWCMQKQLQPLNDNFKKGKEYFGSETKNIFNSSQNTKYRIIGLEDILEVF